MPGRMLQKYPDLAKKAECNVDGIQEGSCGGFHCELHKPENGTEGKAELWGRQEQGTECLGHSLKTEIGYQGL